MNKHVRTNIVYVFWNKVGGLLRIDIELIQNIARKLITHTQIGLEEANTPNQKKKQDGRMTRTTVV
jgi:hypothetical protein